MMRGKPMPRRRRGRTLVEADNVDRWLVSYADFITLLFAFFVVMYAISSINEGKYRVLSDTLLEAFKTPPKAAQPIQLGDEPRAMEPELPSEGIPKPIRVQPPRVDQQRQMRGIAQRIEQQLKPLVDKDLIRINADKLWVEVDMNTSILFSSGSATLEPVADGPLKKLAGVLRDIPNQVEVEGHTDNVPISNEQFPSNWELSAARAASVVHLFTNEGVKPQRLAAIGYGQYRPVDSNDTPAGRRQNRRVRVVILADKHARRMLEIERQGGAGASESAAGGR
jgi:chemotaxis protein MotB